MNSSNLLNILTDKKYSWLMDGKMHLKHYASVSFFICIQLLEICMTISFWFSWCKIPPVGTLVFSRLLVKLFFCPFRFCVLFPLLFYYIWLCFSLCLGSHLISDMLHKAYMNILWWSSLQDRSFWTWIE